MLIPSLVVNKHRGFSHSQQQARTRALVSHSTSLRLLFVVSKEEWKIQRQVRNESRKKKDRLHALAASAKWIRISAVRKVGNSEEGKLAQLVPRVERGR